MKNLSILLSMAGFIAGGCTSTGQVLKPAAATERVGGMDEAARATDNNVQLIVQADGWPGDAWITDAVTPLRVTATNGSDRALKIRYSDFVLVAQDGQQHVALPPFQAEGEVLESDPVDETYWTYDGYEVAPFYEGYYDDVEPYVGPFAFDDDYYGTYGYYWDDFRELPTDEMLAWSLPEGVLQAGGTVDGYLYFEHVDDDTPRVQFQVSLEEPKTEATVANVSIPFMVVDE